MVAGIIQTKIQLDLMLQKNSRRLHIHIAFFVTLRSGSDMMLLDLRLLFSYCQFSELGHYSHMNVSSMHLLPMGPSNGESKFWSIFILCCTVIVWMCHDLPCTMEVSALFRLIIWLQPLFTMSISQNLLYLSSTKLLSEGNILNQVQEQEKTFDGIKPANDLVDKWLIILPFLWG